MSKHSQPGNKIAKRKTKIVATVGPASKTTERLRELIDAGVNVFRLNFSHGTHDEHLETLQRIRALSEEMGIPAAILQDLSGPKIRISPVDDANAALRDGDTVSLKGSDGKALSNKDVIFVETLNPADILKPGQRALLADGTMEIKVTAVENGNVTCNIIKGGKLRSRVGIAFPDSDFELSAATKKDFSDLAWGIQHCVDYVAESFVSDAKDIIELRSRMVEAGALIPIIAKIERRKAIENIDEIISTADGIMVARGDLGVEMPLEQVPLIQRNLIIRANKAGIPVIVATQMLASMVSSIRPTRAEVSDVATAVLTGTDAVMLSEETAIGEHPAECVRYLGKIAAEAEKQFDYEGYQRRVHDAEKETVADAVAFAARAAAYKLGASAIISGTESGRTARLIARYRPHQPIYGSSYRPEACRRMCLYWGVVPILVAEASDMNTEMDIALKVVSEIEHLPPKATAIITAGQSTRKTGSTSMMTIQEIG